MAERQTSPNLDDPVQYLPGVGPARAADFAQLEVRTVRDLLCTFPRRIDDRRTMITICEAHEGDEIGLRARVLRIRENRIGGGRRMTTAVFSDGTGDIDAVWFNMPWVAEKLEAKPEAILYGKVGSRKGRLQMSHPTMELIGGGHEGEKTGRLLPIYPCSGGLSQALWLKAMRAAIDRYGALLPEFYPDEFLSKRGLLPRRDAVAAMHFPADEQAAGAARARLVYDECLLQQLACGLQRRRTLAGHGRSFRWNEKIDRRIRRLFPFALTPGQDAAIADILRDMQAPCPMHRLVQGDVGSGKTAVSTYALLLAVANGTQAVVMAPTEILARQHEVTLREFLARSPKARVSVGLLLGGMKVTERRTLLAGLEAGTLDVLIATHAALVDDVRFRDLGLAVIDEQHKFGVEQRARLRAKGTEPDMLVMTATPIPRSLALTLYGDLDVSTIPDLPPGRKPVKTYAPMPEEAPKVWDFIRRELTRGRQAFVVSPLVEESETLDLQSATELHESLSAEELKGFRLGLLHGKMTRPEQLSVMTAFRDGTLDVLVSTVVIEVGVNVPNATVMAVMHAERFGLAQLHQLRGRIARGTEQGHCILLSTARSGPARERLSILVREASGFRIAEEDLAQRGEGDFLGTRQHGRLFRLADLVEDLPTLMQAREDAQRILAADPALDAQSHTPIRDEVRRLHGARLNLLAAG